jgi:hypothetical protein
MERITVLSFLDRISLFHTLKPFFLSRHARMFQFTNDPEYVLRRDRNRVLIMVRWFLKPDRVDFGFLERARQKYDRIAFFNGNAGGGIPRFEVLPYVDLFFNKALFKDRTLYFQSLYGDELFSDYYHRNYGVVDDSPTNRQTLRRREDLDKIRVSWNIGVADFPNARHRQRVGVALARLMGAAVARSFYHSDFWRGASAHRRDKDLPVHARLGMPPKKSINFQRKLILERIEGRREFLVGRVSQAQFNHEVRRSRIILSPFGWGELCKRDFEAVYSRSLLLKPDMSHLETWPDVFVPEQTYVAFDWDATDLLEKSSRYLDDEAARIRIAENAFESYHEQMRRLDERFEGVMEMVLGSASRAK